MLPNVEIGIRVPSGRLVIDNDLRHLFPDANEDAQHSGVMWTKHIIEAYGKVGLLHGYVGNSCPGVYKDGNVLYIGNNPSVEKNRYLYEDMPGEHVAGVCTDLWWYSICDYDEFIKRGGKINRSKWRWQNPDVVKVEPGPYVLSHRWPFSDRADSYRKGRMIYATIRRTYRLPRKWTLPEEGLERNLHMVMDDLTYVGIEVNQARTRFELLCHMRDDSMPRVKAPIEDITDIGKIAVLIRKGQAVERKRKHRFNKLMAAASRKPMSKEVRQMLKTIMDDIWPKK